MLTQVIAVSYRKLDQMLEELVQQGYLRFDEENIEYRLSGEGLRLLKQESMDKIGWGDVLSAKNISDPPCPQISFDDIYIPRDFGKKL